MYCVKCVLAKHHSLTFCGECGGKLIPYWVACPHCQEKIPVSTSFCPLCGKPVQEHMKTIKEGGDTK